MGSERINQIEYDISNNLKVNLKTGRLLFTTNIINLFKDEYNLNLNLIYNSKNELNPNMNPLLGNYFRLECQEYIMRTNNLIYYIDNLDRYYLSESYYENSSEIHKHFNDESGLTLIVYKNDNSKILIKDDFGNIKEFTRLANQSNNTYYYVLTKKRMKYNNESSIAYYYNYDENNKLVSMYNSVDNNRIIYFDYNDLGLIKSILINYSNKINGIKLKYNSNNEIIALKRITNSIEEINYLLSYINNELNKLVNYLTEESFEFSYDNNKLIESRIGYSKVIIKESNNVYASEYNYTSSIFVDNYVKDDIDIYDISDISVISKEKYTFSYNTATSSTLVTKVNPLNTTYNIPIIYYYDNLGRYVSHFEVLYNNINRLKNVSIIKGIEILGSGVENTIKINGKNTVNDYCINDYNDFDSESLDDFLSYHNINIDKFNGDYIVYDMNMFIKLYLIYQNSYIVFKVYYSDNNIIEYPIRLSLRASSQFQVFSSSILLRKKSINDIKYKIISSNSSNYYSISNMYLSLGSSLNISYSNSLNDYSINSLIKFKIKKQGETVYTDFLLSDGFYLTQTDLINNFKKYLYYKCVLGCDYFIFNYNNNEKKIRAVDVKYYYQIDESTNYEINLSETNKIVIKNNNYSVNSINETIYSFKTSVINGAILLTNVIEIQTKNAINSITTYKYAYYDLYDNLILTVDECGIIKYYNYDNYKRVINEQTYENNTLVKNITNSYLLLENKTSDGFSYTRECFDNFGLTISEGIKSVNDANYTNVYYNRNDKNKVISVKNTNNSNGHSNIIRYNNKSEVISEYYKNDNVIINNFNKYDNYGRLIKYYRTNKLINDYDNILEKLSYIYNDSFNKVTEQINYSNTENEIIESNYDKYNRLISVKENDTTKLNIVYDTISEKLKLIQDYYKSTYTNYNYQDNEIDEIIEYDLNGNEIFKIKKYDSSTSKGVVYTINNNINVSYTYTNESNKTINPRLNNILNAYFNKSLNYDNMDREINSIISINNVDTYSYCMETASGYLDNNSLITYLKEEVINDLYIYSNQKERISFNYSYFGKNNMLSNYILTKSEINNGGSTFKNKFEFNYLYNDALEVSQDKVIKYDVSNNIIKYYENNYIYDTCGNILSINKKDGFTPNAITSNITYFFIYNNGVLSSVSNNFTGEYKYYTYDYYGNIINIRHYDSQGALIKEEVFTYTRKSLINTYKMYQNGILAKSYKYYYNYLGIRYKKENLINGSYIYYTTNKYDIIYSSNGITYLYGENETNDRISLFGFNYNNKTYFYVKDEVGNIVSIVSDGKEVVRYIYDSYGNHQVYEVNSNGELIINDNSAFIGNINPIRYKSYYYDVESSLYYLNSRYYDSSIGRFISPDDINYLESNTVNGLNLYCYCIKSYANNMNINKNTDNVINVIYKLLEKEIDNVCNKLLNTIDKIKKWIKTNVGMTIIYEDSHYSGYYFFCETKVGTGIILNSDKPINLLFKSPDDWWKLWEYSIGINVANEYCNLSLYGGTEKGIGFGGKNWGIDVSMNALGRLQFSYSSIANNGAYTFESFSLNGPEIALAIAVIVYAPYLLPSLAPSLIPYFI